MYSLEERRHSEASRNYQRGQESHSDGGFVKGFILGVFFTLAIVAAGAYAYLYLGLADVRSDRASSQLENSIISTAVHASIRRNAPELRSPVPPTDVNLITGGRMYVEQCARCHGAPGAEHNGEPAPSLHSMAAQFTESQIFWVAKHGIRWTNMPADIQNDSDEELWALAGYVKRNGRLPQHVKEELAKASTVEPAN
jgi:mono/diheme cytochrome c family protein